MHVDIEECAPHQEVRRLCRDVFRQFGQPLGRDNSGQSALAPAAHQIGHRSQGHAAGFIAHFAGRRRGEHLRLVHHDQSGEPLIDLLVDEVPLVDAAVNSTIPGLDIVPATVDLSGAEVELVSVEERTERLRSALANHKGHDVCFIDCPPSLGLLTLNALCAADTLLVPLQCEFFALEGLSQLLQTVERVQQRFNPSLGIVGVALTMFDRRNRLTDEVAEEVRDCLGNLVFETVIPRNVRLSEAPSHGLPALVYDRSCPPRDSPCRAWPGRKSRPCACALHCR